MSEAFPTSMLGDLATLTMGQSPDSASVNSAEAGLPFQKNSMNTSQYTALSSRPLMQASTENFGFSRSRIKKVKCFETGK